jgi:photosystem II stability/assembly factor-like uncharacterized protein
MRCKTLLRKIWITSLVIALSLAITGNASASGSSTGWKRIGPWANFIDFMAIDPQTPTTLYVSMSGELMKSLDGGRSWNQASAGLPISPVVAIVIDPTTPSTLFARIQGKGVYKSTTGGESWDEVNSGLTNLDIKSLAISSKSPNVLYAGVGGGVFKSTDGGGRWEATNLVRPADYAISALAIDPKTPTTVYCGSSDHQTGIFKTINGGGWFSFGLTDQYIYVIAIDPVTPNTIYAGTGTGVYKSTTGGRYWSAINNGLGDLSITDLVVDPKTPNTLYTNNSGTYLHRIFKSTNGGSSWSAIDNGLPIHYYHSITIISANFLVMDPANPATLYTGSPELYKSVNGGADWNEVGQSNGHIRDDISALAIDTLNPATLYAATRGWVYIPGEIFKSTTGGGAWKHATLDFENNGISNLFVDPFAPDTIFVHNGFSDSWYVSTDGGKDWIPFQECYYQRFLAFAQNTPTIVYSFGNSSVVCKTSFDGQNWSPEEYVLAGYSVYSLVIDPQMPMTLYAGTYKNGLLKTTDGGFNWEAINVGLPDNCTISALAIDPKTPTTLYAETTAGGDTLTLTGIFRSMDGGATWVHIGMDDVLIDEFVIDPVTPTTLYARTDGGGLFKTSNGGDTWDDISRDLGGIIVRDLVIDPQTPTTLYIVTDSGEVFKNFVEYRVSLPLVLLAP